MIRGNAKPDPRRLQRAKTKRAVRQARNIRNRFRELDTADARRAGEKWADPYEQRAARIKSDMGRIAAKRRRAS